MKDPGNFTIPFSIGKYEFKKDLCDSGASINLMPLSVVQRLSLGELTPTTITLQMADRSMAQPECVLSSFQSGKIYLSCGFCDHEDGSGYPSSFVAMKTLLSNWSYLYRCEKG